MQLSQIAPGSLHGHYHSEEAPKCFVRIMYGVFQKKMLIPNGAHCPLPGAVPGEIKLDMGTGCTWCVVLKKEIFEAQPKPITLMYFDECWGVFAEKHRFRPVVALANSRSSILTTSR